VSIFRNSSLSFFTDRLSVWAAAIINAALFNSV